MDAMVGDDRSDFSWMFREEYPAVVRTAYLILGDRAAAEDVARGAFIRLYAGWARVSRYERPEAWVRRAAIRLAGRPRRARRITHALTEDPAAGQVVHSDPQLQRALLALPLSHRAAVVLHYLEGRSPAEVAAILRWATPIARVHLHRARKRLGTLLEEGTPISLDDRLREGVPRVAAGVEPDVDGALRKVVAAGRRRRSVYRAGVVVAAAAVIAAGAVAVPRILDVLRPADTPPQPAGPDPGPVSTPPQSPSPPAASSSCGDALPLHPTYLPEGFGPQPVLGPAPGGFPAEKGQFVVHWTDGERSFEIRHPGTLFAEIAGETDQPTIDVLGYETMPPAPIVPMERDYIVQFIYRPQAAGEAVTDLGRRDCDLWSINEYGLSPAELERVAVGLEEGRAR